MASCFSHLMLGSLSIASEDDDYIVVSQERRFSQDGMPPVFKLPNLNDINLYEITVTELQQHFTSGSFTVVEYTQHCLEQIRKVSYNNGRRSILERPQELGQANIEDASLHRPIHTSNA